MAKGPVYTMKNPRFLILICTLALLLANAVPAAALTAEPRLEAEAAVLMDMTTGEILYEKAADKKMFPASTTKMMTCILALEYLDPESAIIIDDEIAQTGGSSIGLRAGEVAGVMDLLYALMTESANDSAEALACAVSGSVKEFAKLMNERARQFGAQNTNFVNPHGLHNPLHVTTARDLALIAKGCMENETFRMLAGTVSYHMERTNKNGPRDFRTTNRLLWDEQDATSVNVNGVFRHCKYPAAIGIKTGSTAQAGGCLVSAAEQDGTTLLSVVLKSSDLGRFADSITLLDWGFENYKTISVLSAGTELGTVSVQKGSVNEVIAISEKDIAYTAPNDASGLVLTTEVRLDSSVRAPVEAGQKVGEIKLLESGNLVAVYPAIAAAAVEKGGILSIFGVDNTTATLIGRVLLILMIGFILLLMSYVRFKRRQARRKKEERARLLREKKEQEEARRLEWERHYKSRHWNNR